MTALRIAIPRSAGEVLQFAAAELGRHLALVLPGSPEVVRAEHLPGSVLQLGNPPIDELSAAAPCGADSFCVRPTAHGVVLRGATERAVLHGVYALLEQAGFRWSLHHSEPEHVPPSMGHLPRFADADCRPRFRVRGYASDIMTWHYTDAASLETRAAEDRVLLDWMAKTGGNALFLIRHPFDTQASLPHLLPECRRRGIALEYGGHVIPLLLPREGFSEHPEYFPVLSAGQRSDCGNLCASNASALSFAAENASAFVRVHPELSVLHIWGADLWGGGWCRCNRCTSLTPQDQSLLVCNAVARRLQEDGRTRDVCYLAYHDTITPDLSVRPDPRVLVEFAPRERCYGHALNDPACQTNARYRTALERYVEIFDGRVRLFEYYGDAILFCGCTAPLADIIERDLAFAHSLGVREATLLEFGAFSQWAYPLNHLAFATGTRQAGADCARLYAERFGRHAEQMVLVFARLSGVLRTVLTYGDVRRPPRAIAERASLHARLTDAVRELGEMGEWLDGIHDARVTQQAMLIQYTRLVLDGVRNEVSDSGPADLAVAQARYREAQDLMATIDSSVRGLWGCVDLPLIHRIHDSGGFGPPPEGQ